MSRLSSGQSGARYPTLVATAIVLGWLVAACSTTSSPPTTTVAQVKPGQLLTASDLSSGWVQSAVIASPTNACSAPPTTVSMVGPAGKGVEFTNADKQATVVEYAVRTSSVLATYGATIRRLQIPTSCSQVSAGRTQSSTFEEVLPLNMVADGSVAMLLAIDNGGVMSNAGYVIARHRDAVIVVGLSASGSLDTAALQRFAALAIDTFAT